MTASRTRTLGEVIAFSKREACIFLNGATDTLIWRPVMRNASANVTSGTQASTISRRSSVCIRSRQPSTDVSFICSIGFSTATSASKKGVRSLSECVPRTAATSAPALDPEITRGNKPSSCRDLITPTWKGPSAPAPLSIRAERPKQWLARWKKSFFSALVMTFERTFEI